MKSVEERFWSKVIMSSSTKVCWEWLAGTYTNGYGQFRFGKKKVKAHRFSYELEFGKIPNNLNVLHKCDNKLCVNPHHLFLGTHQDNMKDKVNKNRQSKAQGIKNGMAKLTENVIIEIRKKYKSGLSTQRQLAKEYNISFKQIHNIVRYKRWKHLHEDEI